MLADPARQEAERARQRAHRQANPDASREKLRRSYARHAEERRAKRQAYRTANLELERARDREQKRSKPAGYHAELKARQRARRHGGVVHALDYQAIIARDGLVCHICAGSVAVDELAMDHVIPLARGGSHTYGNVRVSHDRCNRLKIKQDKAMTRSADAA